MEEAPRVREAVEALLRDVEPAPFRERLERTLEGRDLVPGVLTVRTAAAVDASVAPDAADRAAGVQLTYHGLQLTRRLVEDEPWARSGSVAGAAGDADGPAAETRDAAGTGPAALAGDGAANGGVEGSDPDVDVLAAEVLVAKGLNQLAYTGVRERVVEIVRRFGRVHFAGEGREPADPPLDADIVVLAVAAGADLAAQTVPPGLVEYARDLAVELGPRPLRAGDALGDVEEDVGRIVAAAETTGEERSRSSLDP